MSDIATKKAYIHIGPGKTGSTSVQAFLRHNRDELKKRGLIVPALHAAGGRIIRNHLVLSKCNEIAKDGSIKDNSLLWPQLDEIISSREHDIVLSSEHFRWEFLKPGHTFSGICAYFKSKGYRPVVLAYIRDQAAWLNSRYVQNRSRLFSQKSFDEFIDDVMEDGSCDPWNYLKPYIDNADCDLAVIPFETSVKLGLETEFVKYCGVSSTESLEIAGHQRPNAGAKTVYASQVIMERLNYKVYRLDNYKNGIKSFNKWKEDLGWDKVAYNGLTSERVDRIRGFYDFTNDAFAQRFLGVSWKDVCPMKPYRLSVFDPAVADQAEKEEIDDVVDKVVKRFSKFIKQEKFVGDAA